MRDAVNATVVQGSRGIRIQYSDGTEVAFPEPRESLGAGRPTHPSTVAEAAHFKFAVRNQDGLRELTPQSNGSWTSRPTTEEKFAQDPRPMAHLKPMSVDLDLNDVVRLPGDSPDHEQWYIVPNSRVIGGTPKMACNLLPVDDPCEHHGLIGSYNMDFGFVAANAECIVPVGSPIDQHARLYTDSVYSHGQPMPMLPDKT